MSFWIAYGLGVASVPLSVVLSEVSLWAIDRLQGGYGIVPRQTTRILLSIGVSFIGWTVVVAGLQWWLT